MKDPGLLPPKASVAIQAPVLDNAPASAYSVAGPEGVVVLNTLAPDSYLHSACLHSALPYWEVPECCSRLYPLLLEEAGAAYPGEEEEAC